MIPYGRQDISRQDVEAVVNVLKSDFLTQGPVTPRFEESVASYCGSKFGIAVTSATSALHLACLSLGLGRGDWLWTSPNTFVASANCALYCGAHIDFVDIDPVHYNLCPDKLEQKLIKAELDGKLPKIVIPVHFAGQPCEMTKIKALSEKFGFKIIEDASHAIGASYKNTKVGSCQYCDITVFSFHPVKIITTGEGGMLVTNDDALAEKLSRLRVHGITNSNNLMEPRSRHEIWNYQQIELGFNYRMTDIQAALGLSQLDRLDDFVSSRHVIANKYNECFQYLPLIVPHQLSNSYSSYHLYPLRISKRLTKITQKKVYNQLVSLGISVNLHYIPVHRHPYYEKLGFLKGDFPEAENFHQEALTIPIFSSLKENDQEKVIDSINAIFNN